MRTAIMMILLMGMLDITGAEAQIQVPSGYEVESVGQNFMGGFDYLPNGDIIGMYADPLFVQNSKVGIIDANGDGIPAGFDEKYDFGMPVWAGFVRVSPGGRIALFGESTEYRIYSMDLRSYAVSEIVPQGGSFDGAFDLAFADEESFYLSANPAYGTINKVFRGDLSGSLQEIISVAATYNSGIDTDDAGNLYFLKYGVVVPPPAGGCALLQFARDDIDAVIQGAPVLGEGDAREIARVNGSYDVAWHSSEGLYVSDANNGRVYRVEAGGGVSDFASLPGDSGEGFRVLSLLHRDEPFAAATDTRCELAVDYLPLPGAGVPETYRIKIIPPVVEALEVAVSSTILTKGDRFTLTVRVQPTTSPFDAYVVIVGPGGFKYSVMPGNKVMDGVRAYARSVRGLQREFEGRVLDMTIPSNIPSGDWTIYAGTVAPGVAPSPARAIAFDKAVVTLR